MTRVFVHSTRDTSKAILVFDANVTGREVRPVGKVRLASVQPGMVLRPAEGRRPDMSKAFEIESVTSGVIRLKSEAQPEASPRPPKPAPDKTD